jgi:hypothetical protein
MDEKFTEFDYLLNALQFAAQADNPAKADYAGKRQALLRHVRELERKADLWNLIESMWSFPGQTLGELVRRIAAERTAGVSGPALHTNGSHTPMDESKK